jgi:putative sigma-54 modulation protein
MRILSSPSATREESLMNLNLTGLHLEITPAIRAYVVAKMDRVTRHFDHVIDVNVHVRGKEIHAESTEPDMYAAIDSLADKLDRQVVRHKEKLSAHRTDRLTIERTLGAAEPGPAD